VSSKREKFSTLCKKLWAAGSIAVLATAFLVSGSPFAPVAHAQGTWDADHRVYTHKSDVSFTLNGETIDGTGGPADTIAAFIQTNPGSDANLTVTNSTIDVDFGYLYASGSLLVNGNSVVKQAYTGILDGLDITITNSEIEQGTGGRISGRTTAKINGSTVKQGNGGLIEAVLGTLTIENNAEIAQDNDGKIVAKEAVVINGALVEQGNKSIVESRGSSVSITSSTLIQGNDSAVLSAAGEDIIVASSMIYQDLDSTIRSGGELDFTNSDIFQLGYGTIESGAGMTMNNSAVSQGANSYLASDEALSLTNNTAITQGDDGLIAGDSISMNNSSIRQGDGSTLQSDTTLSTTGGSIHQGADGTIQANSTQLSGTTVNQGDDGSIKSNTTMSITGGTINQANGGKIRGNTSVVLSGATVNQEKNGEITSGGTMSITGGTITQGYGSSVITSTGNMTLSNATINQSTGMNGSATNAWLGSAGTLAIDGTSKVTQGGGGRIYGNAGVGINGTVLQGDNSKIETLAGSDIVIAGSVTQGNGSSITTSGSGKLDIQNGAKVTQGHHGTIVNGNNGALTLDNVEIEQANFGTLKTGGDLTIANGSKITQGSNSYLSGSTITIDGAKVTLGADSKIGLGASGVAAGATDAEKEAAATQLNVIGGSTLELGSMSLIVNADNPGGGANPFHKIHIGANSKIWTYGLFTFNNDWLGIDATGTLVSTDGVITLTNKSKIYGTGTIESAGLIVTSGSILSPGDNYGKEIGTLHITGPLMVTSSGVLEIDVDGNGNSDLILVSHSIGNQDGDVLLCGNEFGGASVILRGNFDPEQEYTIIQAAGTISGELSFKDTFFDAEQWIDEEAGQQYLRIGALKEKDSFFAERGKTFNQVAAGRMLDAMQGWGDIKGYFNQLYLDDKADFLEALNTLAGGVKANSLTLSRENPWRAAANQFGWTPSGQLVLGDQNRFNYRGQNRSCPTRAAWATPYYTEADYRSDGNAGAYTVRSLGFMAGFNQQLDQKAVVGVFFGYGRPELEQGRDDIDMDDFTVGLTAGGMITTKVEWKAIVAGGFQNYSMKRFMNPSLLGAFGNPILTSDFDGNTLFASIELARPFYLNTGVLVRPLVAFESENVWQQGFRESGSPFALQFDKVYNDRTFVRTGLNAEIGAKNLTLLGRAFYSHQLGGSAFSQNDVRFAAGGGTPFVRVRGIDLERHFATFGAGGNLYLNSRKTQTVAANYDATLSAKSTSHAAYLSFTQMF